MTGTISATGSTPAQADETVVEFPGSPGQQREPKPESGAEDRARRLAAEVERLARQSPAEWLYYIETGIAEKFGIAAAAMKEMVEATVKANEKKEREAKGESRRKETSQQRRVEKERTEVKRDQEREQARLEKESARREREKEKTFASLVPLPSKEREARLAALAKSLDEDLDTITAEFEVFVGSDKREPGAIEPWGEPVATKDLLTDLTMQIRQYIVVDDAGAATLSLWTMFAWAHESASHSPILIITSAEKDSGKTTLLGVLGYLTPRPYSTVEMTGPGLFHIVDYMHPTLIVDEADKLFQRKYDLLHIINSGWTRGTKITRIVRGFPREFDTFCPKIIGMKGLSLPDTLASRGIAVKLWPKTDAEKVSDFGFCDNDEFETLRRKLVRWSTDNAAAVKDARPALPLGFSNRLAANWKMLFAIADLAGRLDQAHRAAAALTRKRDTMSEGLRLLASLREVFERYTMLSSADVVKKLTADKAGEWCEFRGHGPITQRQVALLLDPYDINPGVIHPTKGSTDSARGYKAAQFADVFARYLPYNRTTVQPPRRKPGK